MDASESFAVNRANWDERAPAHTAAEAAKVDVELMAAVAR